jgi:hypothetical protein
VDFGKKILKQNDEIGLIKTDFLIIGSMALGLIPE